MKNICDFIIDTAPHGAGINEDYENIHVSHDKTGNLLLFENAYTIMNENGFYEGSVPFRVCIANDDIRITFIGQTSGRMKYLIYEKYADVREYLEQVYMDWILDFRTKFQFMNYNKKRLFPHFSL